MKEKQNVMIILFCNRHIHRLVVGGHLIHDEGTEKQEVYIVQN